jgi:hypothetical protein
MVLITAPILHLAESLYYFSARYINGVLHLIEERLTTFDNGDIGFMRIHFLGKTGIAHLLSTPSMSSRDRPSERQNDREG